MYECTLPVSAFYCTFNNSHHQSIKLYSNDILERRCVHNLPLVYAEIYKRKSIYTFGKHGKESKKKSPHKTQCLYGLKYYCIQFYVEIVIRLTTDNVELLRSNIIAYIFRFGWFFNLIKSWFYVTFSVFVISIPWN